MNSLILAKDKFDKMMINICNYMFDIRILLSRFICDLLEQYEESEVGLDLSFPFEKDGKYEIVRGKNIFYDIDDESIKVTTDSDFGVIDWGELDINSQDAIANYIHLNYVIKKIDKNISIEDELH
ncbi:hypothetical protein ACFL20_07980 [Spirochaetota bacterium]